ncbi:hypothetical protein ADK57_32055 [Streptomyces sp. MMG1533]|uniref:hypothetical protein n=1 Tax=Streptomyces sp. MMG1533 TaxID=1415546 RepID=UPI0006B058C6|nr:hypothetical protein [Streptomyces sp. MMG1533]KOU59905.1 hypothetical protein ADK57_32055 [Streptomyces sp. MMG1533]
MPELMVQIDGKTFPLSNCTWITWAPCGCPCGALTAAYGDRAHATEEQAWREHYPLKRDRDKYQRQGYRMELMSWDRYRAEVDLAAKCPHVKAKTSQQSLDAAAS